MYCAYCSSEDHGTLECPYGPPHPDAVFPPPLDDDFYDEESGPLPDEEDD